MGAVSYGPSMPCECGALRQRLLRRRLLRLLRRPDARKRYADAAARPTESIDRKTAKVHEKQRARTASGRFPRPPTPGIAAGAKMG